MPPNSRLIVRLQTLSRSAALIVVLVGCLVTLAWIFKIVPLTSVSPGTTIMALNAALCFTIASIPLLRRTGSSHLISACGILIIIIGILTLIEHAVGWYLRIDQGLVSQGPAVQNLHPQQMSALSAISFCLIGSSLLLAQFRRLLLAQSLTLLVALIALLSLTGYLYGIQPLYEFNSFLTIRLLTAVTFIILCHAIFFAYPEEGLAAVVVANYAGGRMARRALPTALIIPLVFGWISLKGQSANLYDTQFALALSALSNVIVFSGLVFWTARSLNGADAAMVEQQKHRQQADEAIKRYAQRLEVLHDIDKGIIEATSIPSLIEAALKHIRHLIPCQVTGVILFDEENKEGTVFALDFSAAPSIGKGMHIPLRPQFLEDIARSTVTIINDSHLILEPSPVYKQMIREGIRSSLRAQLISDRQTIGVLSLNANTPNFFTTEHQQIALEIANQIAIALHQLRLSEALMHHTAELERYVAELEQAEAALRQSHEQLETRVQERTRELMEINQTLEKQIIQRKHAEDQFRALLESAPDAVIIVNASGAIALINAQTEKFFGYTRDELLGKPVEMFIPENFHSPDFTYSIADPRRRGTELELYGLRKDGSQFPVEVSLSPIETEDGTLIACSVRDITGRKQIENALRDNEEKLQTIFKVLPVGVALINPDRQIVNMNLALEKILDLSLDNLLRGVYRTRKYIHRDGISLQPAEFPSERAFIEQQTVLDVEIGVIKEDGITVWTSVSAAPLPGHHGVVTVTVDITARKQAEETLRESERQFRLLAQNSPDVIYIMDLINQKASYLNRIEFLGYSQSELEAPGSLLNALHPDDKESLITHWRGVMIDRKFDGVAMIEYRLQDKKEQWQWVRSRETVFASAPDGKPTQILVTLSVITEHKQAELQAIELEKNQQRVKILSDFIRDTSHDFRTPLTIINTSLYLLSKTKDLEKQTGYLASVQQQILRLTQLVNQSLIMVRLDSEVAFELQHLDLNTVISDFLGQVSVEAKEKGITVMSSLANSPLIIQVDPIELGLALTELGKNAVLYTSPNGVITIHTQQQDIWAVIEVQDTGMGIPEADLPYIFQPLYRVDKARALRTGGGGLGLSIAKRIIELHQGHIVVESTLGEGSLFRAFLPLRQ